MKATLAWLQECGRWLWKATVLQDLWAVGSDGKQDRIDPKTSLGSLVATGASGKTGLSEAPGGELGSGCQAWLEHTEATIPLGSLCGSVSPVSQTRDTKPPRS